MRVAIATVQIPFITGGAEILASSLQRELRERGHDAEIVTIPFKWYPPESVLDCMLMSRLVDLREVNGVAIDRVVALKFPAYYVEHPNTRFWIVHQHRQAYDLYGTEFGDLHHSEQGRRAAAEIRRWDNVVLGRASKVYAISRRVVERLQHYNGIAATPLYHPPVNHERYRCESSEGYVLYPGRFDPIKRQLLLIEALARTKSPIRAVLIGAMSGRYADSVKAAIRRHGLGDRVSCLGQVSEERKLELYARALAVYNGVYDEDYGYATLEGFFACKPVITHVDSGGPLEFVRDSENGFITQPDAEELARCLDTLQADLSMARSMGVRGRASLDERGVSWDRTLEELLN